MVETAESQSIYCRITLVTRVSHVEALKQLSRERGLTVPEMARRALDQFRALSSRTINRDKITKPKDGMTKTWSLAPHQVQWMSRESERLSEETEGETGYAHVSISDVFRYVLEWWLGKQPEKTH